MHTDHVTAPPGATDGLEPEADDDFVLSPEVQAISDRALTYLEAGYPVHFCGPAGTGKTSMAVHVAAQRGRPVSLMHGSDHRSAPGRAGPDPQSREGSVVDQYISSVTKTQLNAWFDGVDDRLAAACACGHTLIYDEFNRSRADATNTLLSMLEHGMIDVPTSEGRGPIVVHPDFRLVLTSNPAELAGVHDTQDALLDRLVTIEVGHYDRDTEVAITAARSGIDVSEADRLVAIAREFRACDPAGLVPTVRSTIALARVIVLAGVPVDSDDERFLGFAWDILGRAVQQTSNDRADVDPRMITRLMGGIAASTEQPR